MGNCKTVNGVSKAYAMTGWRIGFGAGPAWWLDGMRTLLSQTSGGPCSISQAATIAALDGPQDFLADWLAQYRKNRDLAVERLSAHALLDVVPPDGAFYLHVGCGRVLGRRTASGMTLGSTAALCGHLLDQGVVAVPGTAFCADPCMRLSIATSARLLGEGLNRLCAALDMLRQEGERK